MAIQAQMADGTILEFPDGTPDSVVDGAVQEHLSGNKPVEKGFFEGLADAGGAAITNRGLGLMQTAQDVGLPVNKLFGVTPEKFNEASQKAVAGQEKLAEGNGISGAIVGGLADPLNLVPLAKYGKLALPAYGAASGFTGGKSDNDGLSGRVGDAGVDAALAYGTGKAFEVGAKIATPVVRKAAEYIPDAVTDRVSAATNYVADKLKPTAAGPTIDSIKESARYGAIPKMSPQDIGEAAIKQKSSTADLVSGFYNIAEDVGDKFRLPTAPLIDDGISLYNTLPEDIFGKDKGTVLKQGIQKLANSETVSAKDLIEIDKNINQYWNLKQDGRYKTLFDFQNRVRDTLDSLEGDGADLFKTAWTKAKQSHEDLTANRFTKNKITNKLLPEDDFQKLDRFNKRKLTDNPSDIPDDTMQKLTQFVDKVTTPEEVTAALKLIPADQREAFVKTALKQKMSQTRRGELMTALINFPRLITSNWRQPVGAAARVVSPTLNDAGAIKELRKLKKTGFTDATFDKYQKMQAELKTGVAKKKASDQQLKDLADEMMPVSYPKAPPKPLALPAPENVLSGKSGKTITNATPEQRATYYKTLEQPAEYKSIPKITKMQPSPNMIVEQAKKLERKLAKATPEQRAIYLQSKQQPPTKIQTGTPVDVEVSPRRDIIQQFTDAKTTYFNDNAAALKEARLFDELKNTSMKDFLAKIQSKQYPGDKTAFSKAFDAMDAKKAADIAKPMPRAVPNRKGDNLTKQYNPQEAVYDDATGKFVDPNTGITIQDVSSRAVKSTPVAAPKNSMAEQLQQAIKNPVQKKVTVKPEQDLPKVDLPTLGLPKATTDDAVYISSAKGLKDHIAAKNKAKQQTGQSTKTDMFGAKPKRMTDTTPKPILQFLESKGRVRIGSDAEKKLKDMGVTRSSLFSNKGKITDLSDISNSEFNNFAQKFDEFAPSGDGKNIDADWLLNKIDDEQRGRGFLTAKQREKLQAYETNEKTLEDLRAAGFNPKNKNEKEIAAKLRELANSSKPKTVSTPIDDEPIPFAKGGSVKSTTLDDYYRAKSIRK